MNPTKRFQLVFDTVRYNLKVIFANKFIYFLLAALAFYLMVIGIMLFSDTNQTAEDIFDTILFPGILVLFYPVIFNIQNDKDARILEIIFGIPNYRYKVYLVRFIISMLILFIVLILMVWFSVFAIVWVPVFEMVYQLMYPLFFLACVAFMFSTLLKNGNGAAVIMIIIGLVFLILNEPLGYSKWNIFLNPFEVPSDMNQAIWRNVIYQNRLLLVIGSVIFIVMEPD